MSHIESPKIRKSTANPKSRNRLVAIFLVTTICAVFVTTAWATLSLIKPHDVSYQIEEGKISEIPSNIPQESKSRAPEPTTMDLFGGGLFGMIVRFVRKSYAAVKRIIDIVLSIAGLALLSPLCIFTILLIKLTSRGPVFFTQTRVGKGGELFEIYKFRTMKVD